jgi:putative effector of murein hydrolase
MSGSGANSARSTNDSKDISAGGLKTGAAALALGFAFAFFSSSSKSSFSAVDMVFFREEMSFSWAPCKPVFGVSGRSVFLRKD